MFQIPPPRQFLVLSAPNSAPFDPSHKFLVLSPTESGPDPRLYDEQAVSEVSALEHEPELHRSHSSSSTLSEDSSVDDVPAVNSLPAGFLFLGHNKNRRASQ
ncbi:hypothetical protein POX_c04012 [Penicillium oxalicum]|uniref:Uncharacterized protein n=1 Tax=Penicillium oxalicum (strain 114-2 / CGMCC 5302) TaxID=933388 RepID=S8AIP2_PENO1|nr:hypothetical protein POX_c04012 [Penicillium oxalicum]EPS25638.1 hypothetical protein PDE_00572 [Penicillium oxalicum 114-2]KAI2791156.1 hypothetical protein POX_c04012 [Penicillium oxalicum]